MVEGDSEGLSYKAAQVEKIAVQGAKLKECFGSHILSQTCDSSSSSHLDAARGCKFSEHSHGR